MPKLDTALRLVFFLILAAGVVGLVTCSVV